MAVRGRFSTDSGDEYQYNVVQYRMTDSDRTYVRGATPEKLDSAELDWVRLYISDPKGDPTGGIYATLYGPYLDVEDMEYELAAWFDESDYGEAVG